MADGQIYGPRLQRWLIGLGEYNFHMEYIKGENNNSIREDEINLKETESTDEDVQAIHSQEEDQRFDIPILDTVVNRFKVQLIFAEGKTETLAQVFLKNRIYISKKDLEDTQAPNILRQQITTGKIGVFPHTLRF